MRVSDGKAEIGDIVKFPDGHVDVARRWPHGNYIIVANTNGYFASSIPIDRVKSVTRKEAIKAGFDPDSPRSA